MEGGIYERTMSVRDGKEDPHFRIHTMPVGLRGIGVDSGEEFRATESIHQVSNTFRLRETGSYRHEIKLVGKRTQRTWWLITSGMYRIDADGRTAISQDTEKLVCRAGRMD